jgi:hypothetical protein
MENQALCPIFKSSYAQTVLVFFCSRRNIISKEKKEDISIPQKKVILSGKQILVTRKLACDSTVA